MSNFIDLTIPSGSALSAVNLKLPTSSSTAHLPCPGLGYVIKSKGNISSNARWEKPITDTITDAYAYYVTEPSSSKSSVSTYSGSAATWTASVGSNGYAYMFGSTSSTSTVNKRVYMTGSTYYITYSIPAGKTIHVDFTPQGHNYMSVNGSTLYSAQQGSTTGTFYLTISTSNTANTSVLKQMSVTTPIYTSTQNYKNTYSLEYTNTGTTAKTVYVQCYAVQSAIPFLQLKKANGSAIITTGTLNFSMRTSTSVYYYSNTAASFQTGGYYGTNGIAFASNSLKTATVNIPSRFGVISGNYGLKITSSGIQKTTNGGQTWVSY